MSSATDGKIFIWQINTQNQDLKLTKGYLLLCSTSGGFCIVDKLLI